MLRNIHLIIGARPNYMKIAPLFHELINENWCKVKLIDTGQHFKNKMSKVFLKELKLIKPHYSLGRNSGTHGQQTSKIIFKYELLCYKDFPDLCLVVGDVNSTLSCSLVAAKLKVPIAHLEAGLRSFDNNMPEEINRKVVDSISTFLFTHSEEANKNLINEGHSKKKIKLVGNIMIDCYEKFKKDIDNVLIRNKEIKNFIQNKFYFLTLHRPENVDDHLNLERIVETMVKLSKKYKLLFAIHPRTQNNLKKYNLLKKLLKENNILIVGPQPYLTNIHLITKSKLVITDSGGIQEETSHLNIPCLTLRKNTERPITVTKGTNQLVNLSEIEKKIYTCKRKKIIPFWDGKTAKRIVKVLRDYFNE